MTAIITKFKLFERGDDDDIELGPKIKMVLGEDGKYSMGQSPDPACDYILSVPSGEVVIIDDLEIFKRIISKGLASYTYSFKSKILNCYVCRDDEIHKIKEYIKEIRKDYKVDDNILTVCEKFIEEMKKVLKKKHVVAYIPNHNTLNYYYIIIPDLNINKPFYKQKSTDMLNVLQSMQLKYPNSIFSYVDRMHRNDVKYYGLPDRYDSNGNIRKETPKKEIIKEVEKSSKEICTEIRNDITRVTRKVYEIEHAHVPESPFYYFNIPPKDITFFDNLGKTKINFVIYNYSEKYPYMRIDWLSNFVESNKKWESGIFVMRKNDLSKIYSTGKN